jgi:hypothetical protein
MPSAFRAAVAAILIAGVAPTPPPAGAQPPADVQAKLDSLPVQGRAPKTGYSRSQFGDSWSDDVWAPNGHNGCDTRNDILRDQLVDVQFKPDTNNCVVLSGVLNDPYTGTSFEFHRGPDSSDDVQIDHIVALSDAWQTGAQQLDEATRRNLANDPLNLQATLGWVNHQKADSDAASWLPPNTAYRCAYVSRIVEVKAAYRLWVTPPEHDAIARVLSADCG